MRILLIAGALAAGLAACQSSQQSMNDAQYTCDISGLRPGSAAHDRCVNANYMRNRQQADNAATAVAVGAAAGVVGGALVGAAASRPSYGYYRPYYRCNGWGCW